MKKTRILMVDDDIGVSNMTKWALESSGDYEVTVVNQSRLALNVTRELIPDLILLDICMPGLDGGDIFRLLQDDPQLKSIPVLMMSSLVSQSDVGENLVAKVSDMIMLPKPSSVATLKRCIGERLVGAL